MFVDVDTLVTVVVNVPEDDETPVRVPVVDVETTVKLNVTSNKSNDQEFEQYSGKKQTKLGCVIYTKMRWVWTHESRSTNLLKSPLMWFPLTNLW